jgi:hypothetical protein
MHSERKRSNVNDYISRQSVLILKNSKQISLNRKGDVFVHLTGKVMYSWI